MASGLWVSLRYFPLLKNPKHLGSDRVGFFGALHTWGRDIKDFHPHVHFVVRGGGVSADGSRWLQTPAGFLFPAKAAAAFYKQRFVDHLRQSGLYDQMPYGVLKKNWVVNIKPVSNGAAVLKYLAPYVYRVAISDKRIKSVDDDGVTYRVKPSGETYYVDRRLSGQQFVRAFAQHILPSRMPQAISECVESKFSLKRITATTTGPRRKSCKQKNPPDPRFVGFGKEAWLVGKRGRTTISCVPFLPFR